jgi:transcription elongation factor GreA
VECSVEQQEEVMAEGSPSIVEAVAKYIATVSAEDRVYEQQELNKFIWWFGSDRSVDDLSTMVVEGYQSQVIESGADMTKRLTPVKAFLTFAQKQGFLPYNMAKFIKIRRTGAAKKNGVGAGVRVSKPAEEAVKLTAEGHAKMKAEYEHLTTEVRTHIADLLLEARRDKDIRENAGYDAAKQQQGMVEARIRELERILAVAEVIEENGDASDRVMIGSTVVICDLEDESEVCYMLVSPDEVNPREGKISTASPVGKALLDHREGDIVEVAAPAGTLRYRVVRFER